ncbi:hypothetical protein GGTG_12427 [Gaeumannomyces tritici R3-111a-1]|uniref:Uncharacterized protein n=1 Tax=Gaeumannomyces tritici (strain R3-111a-1) TaxID=644352 RepID=J3PG01_GAET3|nr:hypothetical protein GGTG_12427 [Gaeumannomyces tritici R3-111a-1]EJT70254.1 hypothetical protein GGTG_12427 [Gaeumannomyces tritici R3-111a-1]
MPASADLTVDIHSSCEHLPVRPAGRLGGSSPSVATPALVSVPFSWEERDSHAQARRRSARGYSDPGLWNQGAVRKARATLPEPGGEAPEPPLLAGLESPISQPFGTHDVRQSEPAVRSSSSSRNGAKRRSGAVFSTASYPDRLSAHAPGLFMSILMGWEAAPPSVGTASVGEAAGELRVVSRHAGKRLFARSGGKGHRLRDFYACAHPRTGRR